jgi:hypothetical protein
MAHDPIPDSGVTVDEFARNLKLIAGGAWQPTEAQLRFLREMTPAPLTRRLRIAKRLRSALRFYEELGFALIALPRTGPAFARELWHELRTGQPPAWSALAYGFAAAMFLLSIGLLASAASR